MAACPARIDCSLRLNRPFIIGSIIKFNAPAHLRASVGTTINSYRQAHGSAAKANELPLCRNDCRDRFWYG
jgi:hypothetical protein